MLRWRSPIKRCRRIATAVKDKQPTSWVSSLTIIKNLFKKVRHWVTLSSVFFGGSCKVIFTVDSPGDIAMCLVLVLFPPLRTKLLRYHSQVLWDIHSVCSTKKWKFSLSLWLFLYLLIKLNLVHIYWKRSPIFLGNQKYWTEKLIWWWLAQLYCSLTMSEFPGQLIRPPLDSYFMERELTPLVNVSNLEKVFSSPLQNLEWLYHLLCLSSS